MNIPRLFSSIACAAAAVLLLAAGPTSPSLPLTSAFVSAGGGAGSGSFSSIRAFTRLLGGDQLQTELQKLRDTFGGRRVDRFVRTLDFAFIDGWQRAGQDDVKMPSPSPDSGNALVLDMIKAGTGSDGTFRMSTMMDALLTARVHGQVGADINSRYSSDAVANFEGVGNQFFADLAKSLGASVSIPTSR